MMLHHCEQSWVSSVVQGVKCGVKRVKDNVICSNVSSSYTYHTLALRCLIIMAAELQ
jgi:hypothetical protein